VNRLAAILIAGTAGAALSGCVAAVAVPVGAGAMVAKSRIDGKSAKRARKERRHKGGEEAPRPLMSGTPVPQGNAVLTDLKALPAPDGSVPTMPDAPASAPSSGGAVPPGMQYLYGSGEAAALSYQAYLGVIDLVIARSSDRAVGQKVNSVVLTPDATLDQPKFDACGAKPLAVVLDVDETALLNLGYEANDAASGQPYDQDRWERWERTGAGAVTPVPGMVELARVAKASNVTLVFNSNRSSANADAAEATLDGAGLGPVRHLRNLWLDGDAGEHGGKDKRRQAIAANYCVIAMVGDQLGDFSDLFNAPGLDPVARRAAAQGRQIKILWGHGWFILPNPVYGPALKGGFDQVFPRDRRWTDPGPQLAPKPPLQPTRSVK